jgi:hypothetical protein
MEYKTRTAMDSVLDAVSNVYRRRVLVEILEDGQAYVPDRLRYVANGGGIDPEELRIELFHVHLPKLDASGFVEWDPDRREVRRGPRFDEVAPLLKLMNDHRDELPPGWL